MGVGGVATRRKLHYYINCTLSTIGIGFSFFVVGWVNHENSVLVGGIGFVLSLALLAGSAIRSYLDDRKG
ncbi:hypothetical protein [Pseudomonas phage Astolliot]|nr:hypothetical protein [Pseudomonas phage Astolliot]